MGSLSAMSFERRQQHTSSAVEAPADRRTGTFNRETKSMTLREFARSIVNDPQYRDTVRARANAGTLPEDIELFILELADGRVSPLSADCVPAPTQNPR